MSSEIMCNGHRFVKSTLFQSPGYLADLSPYISAVISSRILATPIQLTANAIKPLRPLAQSILPTKASQYILSGTLTCEYCLHRVSQDFFDDGSICPALLLERLGITDCDFVLADQLSQAQEELRRKQQNLSYTNNENSDPASTSTNNANNVSSPIQQSPVASTSIAHQYKQDLLIMQICPEVGLHAQNFSCVDCDKEIDLKSSRLCHYDGRYYCYKCHTGSDLLPIPARVLKSWDFTPKPVSKASLQKICFLRMKPVLFNLFQINSMLYGFIDRLVEIKQLRGQIKLMLKYLKVCGQPDRPYFLSTPKHFLDGNLINFFTLNDLYDINQVHVQLTQLQAKLEDHIVRSCESCRGKGFYCELCKDSHDILYPFSVNSASCTKCQTVYHKNCFHRKKKSCPRCVRLRAKTSSSNCEEQMSSQDYEANDSNEEEKRYNDDADDDRGQVDDQKYEINENRSVSTDVKRSPAGP